MKTVEKSCLGIVFLLITLMWPVSSPALMIELNLSDTTVDVGDTFTMDVVANDVFGGSDPFEEVLAFGFDIFISDPTSVSFSSATVGSPFDDDSALIPNTDVAGSVFPGIPNDGTNDTILLATLSFDALAPGPLSLGIVSDIADFNEGLIYLFGGNADVTASTDILVQSVASVPEPSTLVLLAIGLAGLGWVGLTQASRLGRR